MNEKFVNTVVIGGRRYVKNNTGKTNTPEYRLGEVLNTMKRQVKPLKAADASIEDETNLTIYHSDNNKTLFSASGKPVGFIIRGLTKEISKAKLTDLPENFEETIEQLQKMNLDPESNFDDQTNAEKEPVDAKETTETK